MSQESIVIIMSKWCLYGLDYVSAYACFHDTSMSYETRYIFPCIELSIPRQACMNSERNANWKVNLY
jgi:hypothetical protein